MAFGSEMRSSIFQYQRPLLQVASGAPFIIESSRSKHHVVSPLTHSYVIYDLERMNVVFKGEESSRIACIETWRDCVVAGTEEGELLFSKRGITFLSVPLGKQPKTLIAFPRFLGVLYADGTVEKIEVEGDVLDGTTAPSAVSRKPLTFDFGLAKKEALVEGMHRLEGHSNKALLSVRRPGESSRCSVLVHLLREEVLYRFANMDASPILGLKSSINPDIVGISYSGGISVFNIKKDKELQRIPIDSPSSFSFRRDGAKEMAVGRKSELSVFCLETGTVKSLKDVGPIAHLEYVGKEGLILVSGPEKLSLWNYRDMAFPYLLKQREGAVAKGSIALSFLRDSVVVATEDKIFHVSLTSEGRNKAINLKKPYGSVLSLSQRRGEVFVHFSNGLFKLEGDGVSADIKKSSFDLLNPNEAYIKVHISDLNRYLGIQVQSGTDPSATKIVVSSSDSGFILGTIEGRDIADFSIDGVEKEVTVIKDGDTPEVHVYTLEGVLKRALSLTFGKENPGKRDGQKGKITSSFIRAKRSGSYAFLAMASSIFIFGLEDGGLRREVEAVSGEEKLKAFTVSADFRWIVATVEGPLGAFTGIKIFDIESSKKISETPFQTAPKHVALSDKKDFLAAASEDRIMLFANTNLIKDIPSPTFSQTARDKSHITFSLCPQSKLRNIVTYEYMNRRGKIKEAIKEERIPFPSLMARAVAVKKKVEEVSNVPTSTAIANEKEETEVVPLPAREEECSIEEMMEPNFPISSIISTIVNTKDPTALLCRLIERIRDSYDMAEVLINRVLYHRYKDIDVTAIPEAVAKRREVSDRLEERYFRVLGYLKEREEPLHRQA